MPRPLRPPVSDEPGGGSEAVGSSLVRYFGRLFAQRYLALPAWREFGRVEELALGGDDGAMDAAGADLAARRQARRQPPGGSRRGLPARAAGRPA